MIRTYDNLFVGDEIDCFYDDKPEWVVVHACKHPCHQRAVGYRGNLNRNHPNYLILEKEKHLFLNMVDMDMPLSHEFTGPIILAVLDFIEKNIQSKNILIHCNHGLSRSPALALLFLAKRKKVINNENYRKAKQDFIKLFPNYQPGRGVDIYLTNYWSKLR
jgi:predicted protein tyrosine phosphatase